MNKKQCAALFEGIGATLETIVVLDDKVRAEGTKNGVKVFREALTSAALEALLHAEDLVQPEIKDLLTPPKDCYVSEAHPASEDPTHWCVGPVIRARDSRLLEESNASALERALEEREDLKDLWETHRFSHWAVGWVEHLSFRVLDENEAPSAVFHFLKEWNKKLESYGVADDDDLLKRECEAALEAITAVGSRHTKTGSPQDWPDSVYSWLCDNEPFELEDRDGQGPSPSEDGVIRALFALGFLAEGDE